MASAINPGTDMCVGFFEKAWDAGAIEFPTRAKVLEIGAHDADWLSPMAAIRPDLDLSGIDVRPSDDARVWRGDVITVNIPPKTFDAIVSISAIEHIGLGFYGDPVDPDGDVKTMQNVARWLKPGGWCYFDVPFGSAYAVDNNFRRYDETHWRSRLLAPFQSLKYMHIHHAPHRDAPYIAAVVYA